MNDNLSTIQKVFLLASAVIVGVFLLVSPVEIISRLVSDDAYYYMNVAKNIADGFGPTFDRINMTDGFHPLWMVTILPIYYLFGGDVELALRVVLILQGCLGLAVLWIAFAYSRHSRHATYSSVLLLGVIFVLASPALIWFNGLESALVIFLLCLLFFLDSRRAFLAPNFGNARKVLFGVAVAAIALARLDTAFLLIGLASWMLIYGDDTRPVLLRPFRLMHDYRFAIIAFLILVAPYLAWKMYVFGHPMPISGALKTTFPVPVFRWKVLIANAPYILAMLLAGITLYYVRLGAGKKGTGSRLVEKAQLNLLSGYWLGCLLHTVWTISFMGWGTFQWHFAFHVPVYAFILVRLVEIEDSWWHKMGARCFAGLTVSAIIVFATVIWVAKGDHHSDRLEAAKWAKDILGQEAVLGLRDAGVFGYFSETHTVNLDGVINGYEFQQAILDGNLHRYLEKNAFGYLADAYVPCDYKSYSISVLAYPGRYFQPTIGTRLVVSRSSEVYLGGQGEGLLARSDGAICFGIWRYDSASHAPNL